MTHDADLKQKISELKAMHPTLSQQEVVALAKHSQKNEQKGGNKRKPSEYNKFMSDEMRKIKEDNPNMEQTKVMQKAAKEWNKQ